MCLADKLEALGSSIRESKQRRWVLAASQNGGTSSRHNTADAVVGGAFEDDGDAFQSIPAGGERGAAKGGESAAEEPGGQVPLELYEHMEREAQLLRTELRHKEAALQERSEVVEHLERKLHVLSHSKDSEVRKIRREAAAAIAGIKMSVGGSVASDAKDTTRRVSGGGSGVKRAGVTAASGHRGPGDLVYPNSLGSFYQRHSPLASPSMADTPRTWIDTPRTMASDIAPSSSEIDAEIFVASASVEESMQHIDVSVERSPGRIDAREDNSSGAGGGLRKGSAIHPDAEQILLDKMTGGVSSMKVFDDVGFLDAGDATPLQHRIGQWFQAWLCANVVFGTCLSHIHPVLSPKISTVDACTLAHKRIS